MGVDVEVAAAEHETQEEPITIRWRYSFFMSPHLAAKQKTTDKKIFEIELQAMTEKPWAMTSEIFVYLSSLILHVLIYLIFYYCLAPVNGGNPHNWP